MRYVRSLWIVGGLAVGIALIVLSRPGRVSADRRVPSWSKSEARQRMERTSVVPSSAENPAKAKSMKKATFGAGCFWGVEAAFRRVPGVIDAAVGYAGGHTENPTYKEVCTDRTGHAEVVQVEYDPAKVTYAQLLDVFWTTHDPHAGQPAGPRLRHPVSHRHLLPRRRAEGRGRGLEAIPRRQSGASRDPSPPRSSRPAPSTAPRNTTSDTSRNAGWRTATSERWPQPPGRLFAFAAPGSFGSAVLLDQSIGVVDRTQRLDDAARVDGDRAGLPLVVAEVQDQRLDVAVEDQADDLVLRG